MRGGEKGVKESFFSFLPARWTSLRTQRIVLKSSFGFLGCFFFFAFCHVFFLTVHTHSSPTPATPQPIRRGYGGKNLTSHFGPGCFVSKALFIILQHRIFLSKLGVSRSTTPVCDEVVHCSPKWTGSLFVAFYQTVGLKGPHTDTGHLDGRRHALPTKAPEDSSMFGEWKDNNSLLASFFSSCMCVRASLQLCLTLCDPMGCSLPGSSVHGILQAWILEWVAMALRLQGIFPTQGVNLHLLVSCTGRWVIYHKRHL